MKGSCNEALYSHEFNYISSWLGTLHLVNQVRSANHLATRKLQAHLNKFLSKHVFVCVKVLWPSQPTGVMSSAVSLPNHTFTGQA